MRCVAWLLFSALCFVATNASANWQYTTWGMTKDQVIAASHGTAVDIAPDRKAGQRVSSSHMTALLQAPYTSGQYAFTAYFRFEDTTGRLVGVHLELQDAAVLTEDRTSSMQSDKFFDIQVAATLSAPQRWFA